MKSSISVIHERAAAEGWSSHRLASAIKATRRIDAAGRRCGQGYIAANKQCQQGLAKPATPADPPDWRKIAARTAGVVAVGGVTAAAGAAFARGFSGPAGRRATAQWAEGARRVGRGLSVAGMAHPPARIVTTPLAEGAQVASHAIRAANNAGRVSSSWAHAPSFARSAQALAEQQRARAMEKAAVGHAYMHSIFQGQQERRGSVNWKMTASQRATARGYDRSAARATRMATTRATAARRAQSIAAGGEAFRQRPTLVEIARATAARGPAAPRELRPLAPLGWSATAYQSLLRQQGYQRRARMYGVRRPGR